jgi:hypothetical protein
VCRGGLYLSNEQLPVRFGLTVEKLQGFLDFSLALGVLLANSHATETAQTAHLNMGHGRAGW